MELKELIIFIVFNITIVLCIGRTIIKDRKEYKRFYNID